MSHLLTLSIHQAAPGLYRARVTQGGVEVTEPSYHQNVESAIFDRGGPASCEGIMGFPRLVWRHLCRYLPDRTHGVQGKRTGGLLVCTVSSTCMIQWCRVLSGTWRAQEPGT